MNMVFWRRDFGKKAFERESFLGKIFREKAFERESFGEKIFREKAFGKKAFGKRSGVFFWMILTAICFLIPAQSAFGALESGGGKEPPLYDQAELFSDSDRERLREQIGDLQEEMGMTAAIVTTDQNPWTAEEYAENFYVDHDLGTGRDHDGVLLLIDMDNRELWISPVGELTRYLTDERLDSVLDDVYAYAAEGDYYGGAAVFLDDVEFFYSQGIPSGQYNFDRDTGAVSRPKSLTWYEVLLAAGTAAFCGALAVGAVLRDYGMKDQGNRLAANFKLSYRKDSAFRMGHILGDILLGTYVTQSVIAAAKKGGGPGRGPRGGGRTTVHRSAGRTFGGRGRKF